jgi:hypothetical protein
MLAKIAALVCVILPCFISYAVIVGLLGRFEGEVEESIKIYDAAYGLEE